MNAEEREEFEENRAELIENARVRHNLILEVEDDDQVFIAYGRLSDFYDFYQDFRPEIEEVM